ncbi:MAG: hypothetical protein HYU68_14170 [Bacteroidetes bacterium]|nr:hypothetical protein [Bacteroidota bacterium]
MKNISVFIVLAICMAFSYHEFFVTVTEGEYKETENTFQFSIKFIGHDLEQALSASGIQELNLGTNKELTEADKYLLMYINKHFSINCNDKNIPIKMIGKEVGNDDFIFCYLESEKVENIQNIEIKNTLLTEVFSAQENILHLKINDKINSISLNKEITHYKISL